MVAAREQSWGGDFENSPQNIESANRKYRKLNVKWEGSLQKVGDQGDAFGGQKLRNWNFKIKNFTIGRWKQSFEEWFSENLRRSLQVDFFQWR